MRSDLSRAASAVFAALAICGCNSQLLGTAQTGCIESLGGAVTASYGCTAASGAWSAASNMGTVSLAAPDSTSPRVSIPFVGEPQTRVYTIADHGTALGGVSLRQGLWFAGVAFPPSGYLSIVGSYTLTLTSVDVLNKTGTAGAYTVHGTLDANLIQVCPEPGGVVCPPVTLHAVF